MNTFFAGERLILEGQSHELETAVRGALLLAQQLRSGLITPRHLLLGFLEYGGHEAGDLLAEHLRPGASVAGVREVLRHSLSSEPPSAAPPNSLAQSSFSPSALTMFQELDSLVAGSAVPGEKVGPIARRDLRGQHVLWAILASMEESELELLRFQLPVEAARQALERLIAAGPRGGPFLAGLGSPIEVFAEGGALCGEALDPAAWEVVLGALWVAMTAGRTKAGGPDLLHALLAVPNGVLPTAIRAVHPGVAPRTVLEATARLTGGEVRSGAPGANPDRGNLRAQVCQALERAAGIAREENQSQVSEAGLARAFLSSPDALTRRLLVGEPFNLRLDRMVRWIEAQYPAYLSGLATVELPPPLPAELCASSELTAQAGRGAFRELVGREVELQRVEQALFRRENGNVLIVGERGTGRTALVQGFARRVAQRQIDFLRGKRLVAVDAESLLSDPAGVPAEPWRGLGAAAWLPVCARLGQVLELAAHDPDIILVLESIDRLLPGGSDLLRRAMKANRVRLIATTTPDSYEETISSDSDLVHCFQKVELREPTWQETVEILGSLRPGLAQEYGVEIVDGALRAAARYSAECILSRRLPQKAVDILKDACDEARYQSRARPPQAESASSSMATPDAAGRPVVGEEQVVAAIARRTDIPASVIAHSEGEGEAGFAERLHRLVVGQEYAVGQVARQIDLIQKGAVPRAKPAAVMLFVGPKATGKTELAKAVAQIYSRTGKLISYQMSDFQERYTVSALLGSPPGYVGYDEGGDLVNRLNADPYAVILFDEFEKACPEVHDVLMRLFEEALITDRRGVTARASRAFIVMTSNLEQEFIIREMERGAPPEEVARQWYTRVSNLRPVRIREEMLSRIGVVAPFGPLRLDDFEGIIWLQFERLRREFRDGYDLDLELDESAARHLALLAAGDQSGGRAVARRLAQHLHGPAVSLVLDARREGASAIAFALEEESGQVRPHLRFGERD